MKERLDRLDSKIDKLDESLNKINITMIRNTDSLEYHIKRTDILQAEVKKIDEGIKPLEKHLHYVHGIAKGLGLLALLAGIIKLFI